MTRAIVSRGVKAHGRQQRIRWQYVRGSCFRYGQAKFLFSCETFGGDSIFGHLGSHLPSLSKSSSPSSMCLCRFCPVHAAASPSPSRSRGLARPLPLLPPGSTVFFLSLRLAATAFASRGPYKYPTLIYF